MCGKFLDRHYGKQHLQYGLPMLPCACQEGWTCRKYPEGWQVADVKHAENLGSDVRKPYRHFVKGQPADSLKAVIS